MAKMARDSGVQDSGTKSIRLIKAACVQSLTTGGLEKI